MYRKIIIVGIILLLPAIIQAHAATIVAVDPEGAAIGAAITISGVDFGEEGYVKFAGLKTETQEWNPSAITVTIPEGASSGDITVVDANGQESAPFDYTIDYSSRVESNWKITDPDKFTLKDYGYFGCANRIESDSEYMYVHYSRGVATYETATLKQKSNFYLPSMMADWKIFGDYIFMVGDFGLRIYKLSELQNGTSPEPTLCGAFTGKKTDSETPPNVTFRYVAIQRYNHDSVPITHNGESFNGTLIAAVELYDPIGTPRIFLFKWDENAQTLELLSIYNGDGFLFSQSPKNEIPLLAFPKNMTNLFCVGLDPIYPKLYVAAGTKSLAETGQRYSYLHEFDISDLNNVKLTDYLFIECPGHVPHDMELYFDAENNGYLWIALIGVGTGRAFNGYDLNINDSEHHLRERTYIEARDPITGNGSIDHVGCFLDIIQEEGLVVGAAGMSTDFSEKHNVFIFRADTTAEQHLPLASSESMDWVQDVTAVPGKIHIADEWVAVHSLSYKYDGEQADFFQRV